MAIFQITHENRAVFGGEKFDRQIRAEYQYTKAQIEAMKPGMIHKFRCKDDDGVTYFWGVCSDPNSFAPPGLCRRRAGLHHDRVQERQGAVCGTIDQGEVRN